jgi:serine acetyltransferase
MSWRMVKKIFYCFVARDSWFDFLTRALSFWFCNLGASVRKVFYGFLISRRFFFNVSNDITLDVKELFVKGIFFPHPVGIVIGAGVVFGDRCTIYQNVTIGTKSGNGKYPRIGSDVVLFSGACIVGDIKIGNRVIVGANSVVTKDIPDDCIVAGCPAKLVKCNIRQSDESSPSCS